MYNPFTHILGDIYANIIYIFFMEVGVKFAEGERYTLIVIVTPTSTVTGRV